MVIERGHYLGSFLQVWIVLEVHFSNVMGLRGKKT